MKLVRTVKTGSTFKSSYAKNIKGSGNQLDFDSSALFISCKIGITGNNNRIIVKDSVLLTDVRFEIYGNNNHIEIGRSVEFNQPCTLWIEDNDCLISIGDHTAFEATDIAVTEPGSKVVIGKDCLFAYDIDIRTGDSHSIVDLTTNKRINYARDIIIGDHVWIASHVSMLKGAGVASNSIVATRSLVTKNFPQEHVLIGGAPATVLKENIRWLRERIYDKA